MPQKSKIKIAVLAGGPGVERKVSLKSGRTVMDGLDKRKYLPRLVVVEKNGRWKIRGGMMSESEALDYIQDNFDLVFIALHGEYGEDGTLQKIFDRAKICYTGSGARASELGMDKPRSFRIFIKHKLNVPDFFVFNKDEWRRNKKSESRFGFPVVVKPADRGSSIGVSIVRNKNDFKKAAEIALKYSERVIVQRYIAGREFTCCVFSVGRKNIKLFPPTEIIPRRRSFFDYYSKYSAGAAREITPPVLAAAKIKYIQNTARRVHLITGCSGMTRTDMILGKDGKFYVLEINTLPGLTPASLAPQAAKAAGISFPRLLDNIVRAAPAR